METEVRVKHTLGPWEEASRGCMVYGDGGKKIVCNIHVNEGREDFSYEEWRANARLIAAAPQLLEALKELYFSVYGGNSKDVYEAMTRVPQDADPFELRILEVIKQAEQ